MRKSAENTQRGLAQTEVHAGNEGHQQQHEDEHSQRPEEQFLGSGGYDLAKLIDDLLDKQTNTHEDIRLDCLFVCARLSLSVPRISCLIIEETWQGRRDSNPQPTVLETVALPIAPLP